MQRCVSKYGCKRKHDSSGKWQDMGSVSKSDESESGEDEGGGSKIAEVKDSERRVGKAGSMRPWIAKGGWKDCMRWMSGGVSG